MIIALRILAFFPRASRWMLYFYLHYIKNYRAKRITGNARIYLPELKDYDALLKDFHWQWASYLAETAVLLKGTTRKQVQEAVTFTNPELMHDHFAAGHKVVLCSAHTAATDWVAQALCIEFEGRDIRGIGHKLDTEAHDRIVERERARYGGSTIWSHEVGKTLIGKRERPDLLFLVGDVKLKKESIPEKDLLPFLGHKIYMYSTTPKLARVIGAHMVYVDIRRTAFCHTQATFVDLSPPPEAKDLKKVQDAYVREMEKSIRSNPGGWWFWNKVLVYPEAGPISPELKQQLDYQV